MTVLKVNGLKLAIISGVLEKRFSDGWRKRQATQATLGTAVFHTRLVRIAHVTEELGLCSHGHVC